MFVSGGSGVLALLAVFGISPGRHAMPERIYPLLEPSETVSDIMPDTMPDTLPDTLDTSPDTSEPDDYWSRVDDLRPASTGKFLKWLRDQGETGEMDLRRLLALYHEFCEFEDRRPLSDRQLQNVIIKAGMSKRRASTTMLPNGCWHKPMLYKLKPVRVQQQRRAA